MAGKPNPAHKGQVGQAGVNDKKRGEFAKRDYSPAPDGVVKPTRKPGVYGSYQVKAFKATASGAFTANLYRDGKHVLYVENHGRGGCNFYHPVVSGSGEITRFEQFAAKAYGEDAFEPADVFVNFLDLAGQFDRAVAKGGFDRDFVVEQFIEEQKAENAKYGWVDANWETEYGFLRNPEKLDDIAA